MRIVFNYPGVTDAEGRQRVLNLVTPPVIGSRLRFDDDDRDFIVMAVRMDDDRNVGVALQVAK